MNGQSFADLYNETDFFIESEIDDIARTNYENMIGITSLFSVLFVVVFMVMYLFLGNFHFYPMDIMPPFLMFVVGKALDRKQKAWGNSYEISRRVAGVFYPFLAIILLSADYRLYGTSGIRFFPFYYLVITVLYVDYIRVWIRNVLCLPLAMLIISMIHGADPAAVAVDELAAFAFLAASVFCYWILIKKYTEDSRDERALKEEGAVDLLTGLFNKVSFERAAKQYLMGRKRSETGVLLIIDFDNFKSVNDEHGHLIGDAILKRFGKILKDNFRESDIVGRVGGDEFMVMMTGEVSYEMIDKRCNDIQHELYVSKIGEAGGFSCSIGAAVDKSDFEFKALYNLADDALYEAKARGKARHIVWYSKEIINPQKNIVYIASADSNMRQHIKDVLGDAYIFMEADEASKALNEISLYQEHLESVFFDYNMPDIEEAVLRRYMNSRPIFSQIPVHDIAIEL